jgi:hypothetical protein
MNRTHRRLSAALLLFPTLYASMGCVADDLPGDPGDEPQAPLAASEAAVLRGGGVIIQPTWPTVSWTRVGTPGYATKIAACTEGDGRVYAMNQDHSIWVSHANGSDSSWTFVTTDTYAQQILCANNTLHVFNYDRSLWRNAGSDTAVNFQYIGKPGGARQVVAATALAIFVPYAVFYALNDDNTLWKSPTGADGSWTQLGRPGGARVIAAGGSLSESRPFALNGDGSLWLNAGDGCDAYWTRIDWDTHALEITAASAFTLYRLDDDHSLWKGTVQNSQRYTTLLPSGQPQRCDGHNLVKDRGGRDQACWQHGCDPGLGCIEPDDVCRIHETVHFDTGHLGPSTDTGNAELWLSSEGFWSYRGWVHESGAFGHNYVLGMALTYDDGSGRPFTFANQGTVHGTFDVGSRDDSWTQDGYDRRIADNWDVIKYTGWRANLHVATNPLAITEAVLIGLAIGVGVAGFTLFAGSPDTHCSVRGEITSDPSVSADLTCTHEY